jgi:hypothetical protein
MSWQQPEYRPRGQNLPLPRDPAHDPTTIILGLRPGEALPQRGPVPATRTGASHPGCPTAPGLSRR